MGFLPTSLQYSMNEGQGQQNTLTDFVIFGVIRYLWSKLLLKERCRRLGDKRKKGTESRSALGLGSITAASSV